MTKTKEKQQGRLMPQKNFLLLGFKANLKGVSGTYYDVDERNREMRFADDHEPHHDLLNTMANLRTYVAQKVGLLAPWDFAREHLKGNADALKLAIQGHEDTINSITITGVAFVGEGDKKGVDIKFYLKFLHGNGKGMNSGKITFNPGVQELGYEDEVEEICEEIRKEVYNYTVIKKKAQLDIETEADKAEDPDMFTSAQEQEE